MKKFTLFLIIISTSLNAQISFKRHQNNGGAFENFYLSRFSVNADMDSDGDQDVIMILELETKIVWFENLDGKGTFSRIQNVIAEDVLSNVAEAGDFDGDGDIDIVYRTNDNFNLVWLENSNGDGTAWENEHTISNVQNNGMHDITTKDLDNDGDIDLVLKANSGSRFLVFVNIDGNGNYELVTGHEGFESEYISDYDVKDFDLDGLQDFVVAYRASDKLGWYKNLGNGNLFSSFNLLNDSVDGPVLIVSEDIDGDSDMDLVVGAQSDQKIITLKNMGTSFEEPQLVVDQLGFDFVMRLGDFDNNDTPDLIYSSGNSIILRSNPGSGTFSGNEKFISSILKEWTSIDVADFNNDGRLDVLGLSDDEGRTAWFDPTRPLSSNLNPIYSDVLGANSADAADFDNDGDMDFVSFNWSNETLLWFENIDGQGEDLNFHTIAEIKGLSSITTSDITGSGFKDIIYTNFLKNTVYYRSNNGSNIFPTIEKKLGEVPGASDVKVEDLDGDGDMDIVAVGYYTDKVYWFENDGSEFFKFRQEVTSNFFGANAVEIADLNNDGRPDIIVASAIENQIVWIENTTSGFSEQKIITDQVFDITSIHVEDINNDGSLDIIYGALGEVSLGLILNETNASSFLDIIEIARGSQVRSVTAGDIDGDLDLDIIGSSFRFNNVLWYENLDGSENFSTQKSVGISAENTSVTAVDMDGDLDVDFLVGKTYAYSNWFENLGELNNVISGTLSLDLNKDGCNEADPRMPYARVQASSSETTFTTFSDENGDYELKVNRGDFSTIVAHDFFGLYDVQPAEYLSEFTNFDNLQNADFCLIPNQDIHDLIVEIYPLTEANPGFEAEYLIVYYNVGTLLIDGTVSFTFDGSKLQFLSASDTIASQDVNNLYFNFTDLIPFQTRTIKITLKLEAPPVNEIDDELVFYSEINPIIGDRNVENNSYEFSQTVIGSFDPNDIQVLEGQTLPIEDAEEYLHYIVRFQNTGNAPAKHVKIVNPLDSNLDWQSMQLVATSHISNVEILKERQINFYFENIDLPDIENNEPESHGYILYKIKPIEGIEIGDIVKNDAFIFFDYNQPIQTNTVSTQYVDDSLNLSEENYANLSIFPIPTKQFIYLIHNRLITEVEILNTLGQSCLKVGNENGIAKIDLEQISTGIYVLKIRDSHGSIITRRILKN